MFRILLRNSVYEEKRGLVFLDRVRNNRGILLELFWILAGDVTKVTDNHDQNQTGADTKDFLQA